LSNCQLSTRTRSPLISIIVLDFFFIYWSQNIFLYVCVWTLNRNKIANAICKHYSQLSLYNYFLHDWIEFWTPLTHVNQFYDSFCAKISNFGPLFVKCIQKHWVKLFCIKRLRVPARPLGYLHLLVTCRVYLLKQNPQWQVCTFRASALREKFFFLLGVSNYLSWVFFKL